VRCVVLLSGGLDSLVAAALTPGEDELVLGLTCDYGQRAARPEIRAAQAQAAWLGCPHQVVELSWLGQLGGSALTEPAEALPHISSEELDSAESATAAAQAAWVPNRNGILVNVAAAFAERYAAEAVVCGFNAEEAVTFPDNSPEFIQATEEFWRYSTPPGLRLLSPTADLNKTEIVQQGVKLGVPLHLVWSCYDGQAQPCWACESCRRLQRALDQAGAWESYRQSEAPDGEAPPSSRIIGEKQ